ncbi:3233_t:CDS:10 [Acaulospora colombiana]|uniref:3233_t:CDS:1 n=1 Tax=Acaulospora colombiana TaxID=27376 RepID=A0ACA9K6Q9_9GLOM|nr:3233_t:CDS:10 [Acaulospora colombiana]
MIPSLFLFLIFLSLSLDSLHSSDDPLSKIFHLIRNLEAADTDTFSTATQDDNVYSYSNFLDDCGYFGITKKECKERFCYWEPSEDPNAKWCRFKEGKEYTCNVDPATRTDCGYPGIQEKEKVPCKGYKIVKSQEIDNLIIVDLELIGDGCGNYGPDPKSLRILVEHQTNDRLRVKIFDSERSRYEIPEDIVQTPRSERMDGDPLYQFIYEDNPFTFSITRRSTGEKIIDTKVPGMDSLTFEEQYMEISFGLPPNPYIYGFGEIVQTLRRNPMNTFQTLWSRDAATPFSENVYGVHPFYMEIRNGSAHGAAVGRPALPPYWALGYHQSRWGYNNLTVLSSVVETFGEQKIPLETIWTDLDYMDGQKDFTWNPVDYPKNDVAQFVKKLHENNQHYVVIVDPAIKIEVGYLPYDEGTKMNVFIKNSRGDDIVGLVWPGLTTYPDWFNNDTLIYWESMIEKWLDGIVLDGLWIDMNEPASWCRGECKKGDLYDPESHKRAESKFNDLAKSPSNKFRNLNNPPYKINNGGKRLPLDTLTLSMDAVHSNGMEPYIWPSVAETSRKYIGIRYSLLPYYYTLFYEANAMGAMVLRPLFIEFPHLKAYIPPGIWYDFYRHHLSFKVDDPDGIRRDLYAPLHEMPLHIRGGYVIPMTRPGMTTTECRKENYYLLVALDADGKAKGSLYLDDGESLDIDDKYTYAEFEAYDWNVLVAKVLWYGYDDIILDKFVILGINCRDAKKVERIMFNGLETKSGFNNTVDEDVIWTLDEKVGKLTLEGFKIRLNVGWNLTWILS